MNDLKSKFAALTTLKKIIFVAAPILAITIIFSFGIFQYKIAGANKSTNAKSVLGKSSPKISPTPAPTISSKPKPTSTSKPTPNVTSVVSNNTSSSSSGSSNTGGSNSSSSSNSNSNTSLGLKMNSVSPSSGPAGQSITISGSGFGTEKGDLVFCPNKCDVGGPVDSWSDTEIKAKVPGMIAMAGSFDFYVLTKSGASSNKLTFTITAGQPRIDGISPSGAKVGDQITLTGGGFGNSGQVKFYSNYPNVSGEGSVNSWSESEIKITLPGSLSNGSEYAVQVVSGGGAESSVKFYTLGN